MVFNFANPYLLGIPIGFTSLFSVYGIWNNLKFASNTEHNYLARIQFSLKEENGTGDSPLKVKRIENKNYLFSDKDTLNRLTKETAERLEAYAKAYGSETVNVNVAKNSDDFLDFFIHFRTAKKSDSLNKLWMDNVHLNQISIDRYGYTFNEDGLPKETQDKVHKLVKWEDIGLSKAKLNVPQGLGVAHFEFNIFNQDIPKVELAALANTDPEKFKNGGSGSNDWYVWRDKDLLAIKFNYWLQTYVFSHEHTQSNEKIQAIIGSSGSSSTDQKTAKEQIQRNKEAMSEKEKKFAEEYLSIYHNNSNPISSMNNWTEVVQSITNESSFITSDKLNDIFEKFDKAKKDISVFSGHLITKIQAGSEDWSKYFNLKKLTPKKDEKEESEKEQKEGWDISGIKAIRDYEQEASNDKIKIYVDRRINEELSAKELYQLITEYSVRYFDFRTLTKDKNLLWPSAIYSQSSDAKKTQNIYVLDIENNNEYGFA
ncbi:hypothetical protein A6V39_02070 [Candidatus Mycoplasma haematobovis]|uniref:Uncharacterized protein n=1 Tax=Candidatus Mycoplasma haematobovis TaxID=432608 RepID=A0A1A9QCB1_9MOLU|nr:hypothetical protein [Candidatus Mycoplasma haematobovis]OAL10212.1 hypothetical protein A6V39_02070 [Candidatus Mycoplasma haematobovis]